MEHGIQKQVKVASDNTVITVCPYPVVITKRFKNVDDCSEKVELSFYRGGAWTSIVVSSSSAFNKSSLINCADRGLPIGSKNASVIALGDYYSAMWIWDEEEKTAFANAVNTAVAMLHNNMSLAKEDIISRA